MNIPYYEMQKKNVWMIDTNSDLREVELITKLQERKLINRFAVKGKCAVYKEFPFSNLREVRNYICGDIDWSNEETASKEKILHAREIRKNPKNYGAEV